jgi:hypothetical protein
MAVGTVTAMARTDLALMDLALMDLAPKILASSNLARTGLLRTDQTGSSMVAPPLGFPVVPDPCGADCGTRALAHGP